MGIVCDKNGIFDVGVDLMMRHLECEINRIHNATNSGN